ncbi:Transcription initiation factor TFIID subunit 13 [Cucumispora dikerogammari]|nr:Transcription initiation factor TFIID subunit 13 [Cucumispora dikerogammari]
MAKRPNPKKSAFINEIRLLLHAFNSDRDPQLAATIQEYMFYYISSVLLEAKNHARYKGKVKTDDILYVIKDDEVKLRRAKELLKFNEDIRTARKAFDDEEEGKRRTKRKH